MSAHLNVKHALTAMTLSMLTTAVSAANPAPPLNLSIYNPGSAGIFPVSSVLVSGKHDAILVDAQFGASQAQQVVNLIKKSGKHLTTIYISHGDPDYYFGLATIKAAYPDVRVVATAQTVDHMRQTVQGKLTYWGPKLGVDAPKRTIMPEVLDGDHLTLEGQQLQIIDLQGRQPERSVVWIPSIRAIVGGVVVDGANSHIWMADTQTPKSHTDWLTTLYKIEALKPLVVVPGHFQAGAPLNLDSVRYTIRYIETFDREVVKAANAADLITAMKRDYPQAQGTDSLDLSAKVAKGEMQWP